MRSEDIIKHLTAGASASDTLSFLSDRFMPAVAERLNEPSTRRRMALYGGDRIPENERNLADVRNRMSLLIEYKLAWIANDMLDEKGIKEVFWTNVVANRYPDLEVRQANGERGIRVEVKCVEAIAEEPAANFDTLKKDLNPHTDYVVVFLWEWFNDIGIIAWDRAPKILGVYVFHASSLAEIRDYRWLSAPPGGLGGGVQGFDFRFAVNCTGGIYKKEEGNYGKILRIWPSENLSYIPRADPLVEKTISLYREFQEFAIWSGFEVLAKDILGRFLSGQTAIIADAAENMLGFRKGETAFLLSRRVSKPKDQVALCRFHRIGRVFIMSDKYEWREFVLEESNLRRRESGKKPKHLVSYLARN